jgi:hypothetical protein
MRKVTKKQTKYDPKQEESRSELRERNQDLKMMTANELVKRKRFKMG